jgi:hypothetical protein
MPPSALACTLFEGDYHLGAAALLNSLHAAGFTGTVICGHRGPPPPWADAALRLGPAIDVRFVPVTTTIHLTNYKPAFLRDLWRSHPAAATLYYFDPDIIVKGPWTVLARWAADGVALVEDVNACLPAGHPYRLAWLDFLGRHQVPTQRNLERYYNAGFIGLARAHAGLLEQWQQVLDLGAAESGGLDRLKHGAPHALFHSADQDALNIALLLNRAPLHTAGGEAMDFLPGGHLLSHAAGGTKPWRGGFLRDAVRGRPPGLAQKAFFLHVTGPLPVLPAFPLFRRRLALRLAALLGRFYRRT